MMPKISVIVPIYNVELYLKECIDSILKQTFDDIEVLLIDDGSSDNSSKIIDEYAQKDSRIKVFHKENGGYGHTCNYGLDSASGEYISIIEPDDYIDKEMYSDLYKIAKEDNSDIVKSGFYVNYQGKGEKLIYQDTSVYSLNIEKNPFTIKEHPEILQYHPSIWSCLYKREFLKKHNIRFVEAAGAGWTDNPFQVQTLCLADRISYTNHAYYYWRVIVYDDMKNIDIPFKRTEEIHSWLNEQQNIDVGVLANLYLREIKYFQIINRIIKFNEIPRYKELLKDYFLTLNWDVIENKKIFKPKKAKFLKNMQRHINRTIYVDKIKCLKKNIASIRLTGNNKCIKLFGYCLWKGSNS